MTTLIYIRHGQSEANLARVFAGHTDVSLTEHGLLQAENTAKFLSDYPISVIYSSDLKRSMQTAEPTAKAHGLTILPRRELREVYAGEWEGRAYDDLMVEYADSYRIWREDCGNAHPEGGESVKELAARIYAETDRIVNAHRGECIAVFSHATPIRTLAARWTGLSVAELSKLTFVPNASVSVIEIEEDDTFRVKLLGYDQHQGELSTAFAKGVV